MLTITINTDNAAFYGPDGSCADPCPELADILRKLAERLDGYHGLDPALHSFSIHDSNGNRVGTAKLG